jgi:D-inositol-3-phosphate glycosyltransferase
MAAISKRVALISVHGDPDVEIGKEEAGGQNIYVRRVGEALAEREGWQVDMFTRRVHPSQPEIVQHTPNCRTIRLTGGPAKFVPRDEIFEYLPQFVRELQTFQRKQGISYRVVHTNYWLSSWVGMRLRELQPIKQVHTYHSVGAVKFAAMEVVPPAAHMRLDVEKRCLETVDRVVATSPQEQQDLRDLVSSQGEIEIIPCGTDIENFGSVSRGQARAELGIAPETRLVLYVGRFDPRKGIDTLVRAIGRSTLRETVDLRLMIVGGYHAGESDEKEYLRIKSIAQHVGIEDITTFTGSRTHEELPTYYAAADVCVVPSHYEPFGLVTIEAMASGTPVVGSDVGGLKFTVVPEQTGLLCPPRNADAFARAIDRILADPAWRNELGQAARDRVESEFSWNGAATHLSDLYLRLMDEPLVPVEHPLHVRPTMPVSWGSVGHF